MNGGERDGSRDTYILVIHQRGVLSHPLRMVPEVASRTIAGGSTTISVVLGGKVVNREKDVQDTKQLNVVDTVLM
jgi:hypothetical protein